MKKGTGKRFNEGKLRYDLLQPKATKGLVEVLTMGANKYGDHNWLQGMKWSNVIASLKRHLELIEGGEDYDKESGLLHIDHVAANSHFLSTYYHIYPEGDDRIKNTLTDRRIGLDLDDVLIDFVGQYMVYFGIKERPDFWHFDYDLMKNLDIVMNDEDFWMNMKPLINPEELNFEPVAYITNRTAPKGINERWIKRFGFPNVPIIQVKGSKLQTCRDNNIEIFVDDRYKHFVELNNNGVMCYLMNASHNERYDVGHKRLMSLTDLK